MSCTARFSHLSEAHTSTVAYTILATGNIVLAIFIIFGNSLILYALYKCQSMHRLTTALYCSLAFSNLGIGLTVIPLFVLYCLAVVFNNVSLFCLIQVPYAMSGYFLGSVSFLTLTTIALDRFYAVKLRLRYHQVVTLKRVVLTLAVCWAFGFIWPFSWLLREQLCMFIAIAIIFCCVVITSACSIKTYFEIRRHQHQIQAQQTIRGPHQRGEQQFITGGHKKSLNTMMLMFCLLLACYLPYFAVVGVTMVIETNSDTVLAFNITSGIIYLNSFFYPFLCCWRMRQIRREVLTILPCFAN